MFIRSCMEKRQMCVYVHSIAKMRSVCSSSAFKLHLNCICVFQIHQSTQEQFKKHYAIGKMLCSLSIFCLLFSSVIFFSFLSFLFPFVSYVQFYSMPCILYLFHCLCIQFPSMKELKNAIPSSAFRSVFFFPFFFFVLQKSFRRNNSK